MIKKFSILFFLLSSGLLSAQTTNEPEMADAFRQDGKFLVVVAVIGIIFAALAAFLFYIERKLSRLEKQMNDNVGAHVNDASQAKH